VFSGLVAVPILIVFVECLLSLVPRGARPIGKRSKRAAVVIPAHDEEEGIGATLAALAPQMVAGDRIVVVADNCSDRTAERARSAGATVIERRNLEKRGKGHALVCGLESLDADPAEIIVFVDADTVVESGSIDALCARVEADGRPVQAVYLLRSPEGSGPKNWVSSLAFGVKNLVRPLGLSRLGLPCHLTGAGMAMAWAQVDRSRLATGNIVEDMQLGIDLAIGGHAPLLCPEARVSGTLPVGDAAAKVQRTRWEHGHLHTLLTQVPRLAWQSLRQCRIDLLALAVDLAVPPLALLCLLWLVTAAGDLAAALRGCGWTALWISAGAGAALVLGILAAWLRYLRGAVPFRAVLFIPLYVLWKVPLYLAFLLRRQTAWVRTPRK
jgi:cellulose synthase/poly-beta-1,6-N-acetylglucosamine synthase-like glycosyltransferase